MLLDMTLRSSHPTAAERGGKAVAHQPSIFWVSLWAC